MKRISGAAREKLVYLTLAVSLLFGCSGSELEEAQKALLQCKGEKLKIAETFSECASKFESCMALNKRLEESARPTASPPAAEMTLEEAGRVQAQVRKLIRQCEVNQSKGDKISEKGVHFNAHGNIDMNRAMRADRKAKPFWKKAQKAKAKAEALLKSVPDPDGELERAVFSCRK